MTRRTKTVLGALAALVVVPSVFLAVALAIDSGRETPTTPTDRQTFCAVARHTNASRLLALTIPRQFVVSTADGYLALVPKSWPIHADVVTVTEGVKVAPALWHPDVRLAAARVDAFIATTCPSTDPGGSSKELR